MKVYVTTIDTYYETMAVATTEAESRRLAADKAFEYLTRADAIQSMTDTPQKILDFFGVRTVEIEVGTAVTC